MTTPAYALGSFRVGDQHGNIVDFPSGNPWREIGKADSFGSVGSVDLPSAQDIQNTDDLGRMGPYAVKSTYYRIHREHPVVYACVEMLVQTASIDAPLYSNPDHKLVPALEVFFANVNEEQDIQFLLSEVYRDLAIAGESFVLKLRKGNQSISFPKKPVKQLAGKVVGLEHLLGEITTVVPDKKTGRPKYVEQKDQRSSRRVRYEMDDVIFFRLPHPSSYAKGLSPLEVLDLTIGTDLQAMQSYERFFANGMSGNKIFSMISGTPEQAERNKNWILNTYTKSENHHKPMFLLGDIKVIGESKEQLDMPFVNGRQFAIDSITAVYSIPRSKLFPDQKGGLGKAGREQDDVTFRRDTVAPMQRLVVSALNRQLLAKEFNLSDLYLDPPAIQIARFDLSDIAESATRTGWTGNEVRTKIWNIEPSDAEDMDRPLFLVRGVVLEQDSAGEEDADPGEEEVDEDAGGEAPELVATNKRSPGAQRRPSTKVQPGKPQPKGGPGSAPKPKVKVKKSPLQGKVYPLAPMGTSGSGSVQKATEITEVVHAAQQDSGSPGEWQTFPDQGELLDALVQRFTSGSLTETSFARSVQASIEARFWQEGEAALTHLHQQPLGPAEVEQLAAGVAETVITKARMAVAHDLSTETLAQELGEIDRALPWIYVRALAAHS